MLNRVRLTADGGLRRLYQSTDRSSRWGLQGGTIGWSLSRGAKPTEAPRNDMDPSVPFTVSLLLARRRLLSIGTIDISTTIFRKVV